MFPTHLPKQTIPLLPIATHGIIIPMNPYTNKKIRIGSLVSLTLDNSDGGIAVVVKKKLGGVYDVLPIGSDAMISTFTWEMHTIWEPPFNQP